MTLEEYDAKHRPLYERFAALIRMQLKEAIARSEVIPHPQSTKHRAKTATSLKLKLEERGLLLSDRIESEIKDLAGVRLIFYTDTDVNRFLACRLIPELFEVHRHETRVHHPTDENARQRYEAIHYTISLRDDVAKLPELSQFGGLRCEIQIQTVLDHAWAEAYHDMIYKGRATAGFGTKARQSLDKRMKRIMDEYLRPAGHELQKAQRDHERLVQGKNLFDTGAFETLEKCNDNNDRYDVLETIEKYVLPNYDDIIGVYPELRDALLKAIHCARATKTRGVETAYGTLEGKTALDVTSLALEVINAHRFADPPATLKLLVDIYEEEQDKKLMEEVIGITERLAKYDLGVWKKVGPSVQMALADEVEEASKRGRVPRPIALVVWRELLSAVLGGDKWSGDTVTVHRGPIPPSRHIRELRTRAINALIGLLDSASTDAEKLGVISVLHEATQLPAQGYSNELFGFSLTDTKAIADLLVARIDGQSFELLQHVEHLFLFLYRRARDVSDDESDRFGCRKAASAAAKSIEALRDSINASEDYVRYKTLVGHESVFSPQWDNDNFDFRHVSKYRNEAVAEYVAAISEETAERWYQTVQRCAKTRSSDLATFPIFMEFLRQLASQKPEIALSFVRRDDPDLMVFLHFLLAGLAKSGATGEYRALVTDYLERNFHLSAIARHALLVSIDLGDTIRALMPKAIARNETDAVLYSLIYAVQNHERATIKDEVFIPAMKYATTKRETRWVSDVWYRTQSDAFFSGLSAAHAELVLENLVALNKIGHDSERLISTIAAGHPGLVWSFLERRMRTREDGGEARYEAIPHKFFGLEVELAKDVELAVETLRTWHRRQNKLFAFTGGRLFHAIFPKPSEVVVEKLNAVVVAGTETDLDFVIQLLEDFEGTTLETHAVVKCLIDRLPEGVAIGKLDGLLSQVGVVSGEFGFVDAYRNLKLQISTWLEDNRPKVRAFAVAYIQNLDQRIAQEQRSAEADIELRRRDEQEENE